MRETSLFQKLATSAINVVIVLIIFLPFYFLIEDNLTKKLILIGLFFIYNLAFVMFDSNRCVGMRIMKTRYIKKYPKRNHLTYSVLYTLSFSTLLFWIYFPFDLFLFNMLVLQLPTVLIKKTTLHGYLAGNITTVSEN